MNYLSKLVIAIGTCLYAALASATIAQKCYRGNANNWNLSSIHYATWSSSDESSIVVTDPIGEQTLELNVDLDRSTGAVHINPDFTLARNLGEVDYGIKRTDGGFIRLSLDEQRGTPSVIHWYDSSLRERGTTKLVDQIDTGETLVGNQVIAILDWIPTGDQLFAYGVLRISGSEVHFNRGFFACELKTLSDANVVPKANLVQNFNEFDFYVLNHPYLAADGDIAYFIEMGSYPELYAYDTRSEDVLALIGLPHSDRMLPRIQNREIHLMYGEIERRSIPTGLYTDGSGFLYTLYRQPVGDHLTEWTLFKLRPDLHNGVVKNLGALRLPTQEAARHLVLLPGRKFWVVFELAAVQENRERRPLAAMILPQGFINAGMDGGSSIECIDSDRR